MKKKQIIKKWHLLVSSLRVLLENITVFIFNKHIYLLN